MSDGPVAIVTGGASGIGRHMAGVLAGQGYRLVVTDINLTALQAEAERQNWPAERIIVQLLDVRDAAAWETVVNSTVERWGRLDYLLNIAGYLRPNYTYAAPVAEVDMHLDTNVKGVIFGTQAAARAMMRQKHGHIINIASLAALAPVPGLALYSASKFAVRAFSIAAAQELRQYGVYVTTLCPDAVETPMLTLQQDYPEAALTFSGFKNLTVQDIERVIMGKILRRHPVEVVLPAWRGWTAKLLNLFPWLALRLSPTFARLGRARQHKITAKKLRKD